MDKTGKGPMFKGGFLNGPGKGKSPVIEKMNSYRALPCPVQAR